jgi:subtilase family serine protease
MTVAVVACAGIVSAQVYSSNIVGYAKKSLPAGSFQIVSPQFLQSGGGAMTLGEAFAGAADQSVVFAWTGSGYTTYTYFAGYAWYDGAFNVADGVVINAGAAVWLKGGSSAATPIMAGEVEGGASVSVNITAGFNLIANPYPVALALGDIDTAGLTDQDVIFAWNGAGYDTYTYFAGYAWYDGAFNVADGVEIAVGDGFWLKAGTTGTLTFNKNF